jgi:hypothetical protein
LAFFISFAIRFHVEWPSAFSWITHPVSREYTTTNSFVKQFPGILIKPVSIEGVIKTAPGKEILRIKFRIWPGRGTPIETSFKQELTQRFKLVDSSYSDWMVSVNYEVEKAQLR